MIFDDHDVNDDWNISESWVEEMRRLPWWEDRVTGPSCRTGSTSTSETCRPPSSRRRRSCTTCARTRTGDLACARWPGKWDRESAATRWAYYRDFGRSRLLVIDSRAARVTRRGATRHDRRGRVALDRRPRPRSIRPPDTGDEPAGFLPPGVHHLEAWNEAVCDGAWGAFAQRLGERLRRAVDLEHWAAFQRSFAPSHRAPATQTGCGGRAAGHHHHPQRRLHTSYVAAVDLGAGSGRSRVHQVVCSPFRNPLSPSERRVVKMTGSRPAALVFSMLARACGVQPPVARWTISSRRTFHNSIGELDLDRRRARVTLFRSTRGPEQGRPAGLVPVYEADLAGQEPDGGRT